jgi:cholesterol oxidase
MWPNRGETDPRPAQGGTYRRVQAVAPRHPAVGARAFGALKLPLLAVPEVPGCAEGGLSVFRLPLVE